ncbi:DUF1501 domain-containing protein [Roseinatronobacter bogoriensis]|uniref:DUF1501 domain-containing protein n=1 Tax=Roseinatronobacter bogoriensis subsp. barguzinensis TaxID=441209 RepID=A0A2K8KH10_9RHOB|nr:MULTISPECIES: DUF1501 domain-containing protein [Rhodobaca]ATX67065.1 DUF1501 domain-containing protein [Rhodobaca barguzinensis]MBB4206574.1 uncharacterized protein (DUF1501 family) [Rhodobaca bogoriensis DSM 18756]TDW41317.1 uncharacterized protein (DUF1501 family) [Rhodobaca barguzinensis]TDY74505.1 uncharacterized protein (DUF1501 family) [Rhodobaca bogoriensis DSM 18756]
MRHRPDRRAFLSRSLALGCSLAASPLITPIALAGGPGDNRLVVIILRGAMDGLDLLRPVGDPHLAALRPHVFGAPADVPGLALDNFFALHPALDGLLPLWQAGELAFVPATSTPYRDRRSHFDGQDHLEAGTAGQLPPALSRDGWLNRLLTLLPGADARTAFAVGRERMLILEGTAPMTQWEPGTDLSLSPQSRLLLSHLFQADPLFAQAGQTALDMTGATLAELPDDEMGSMMAQTSAGDADGLAAYIARQMLGETRIASFSLSGWDTHHAQPRAILPALARLQSAILTLRAGLGPVWGKTTVLAMTEFGRTLRENGSRGTDHGTGGAMLLAGGAIRGGRMIGGWPGLAEADMYAGRDLMPLRDIRAYSAWAMRDLFGLRASDVAQVVFPALDMGESPGLLL